MTALDMLTSASGIVSTGSVLGFVGILAKLVVDWLRGARRSRAEDEVAEGTVIASITEKNLSVADAQIVFLEKANSAERASYERRIVALEGDVRRLTEERDALLSSVTLLRRQMSELQSRLDTMKTQIDRLQIPGGTA